MEWSDSVASSSFCSSLSPSLFYLFRHNFALSPSPSFLSVCRILPMVSSLPSVLVYLPPHSPHAGAVGWRGFLVYGRGCGCSGDILKIVGVLAGGRGGGGGAGRIGQKSSELRSAHQMPMRESLRQILRAERSSSLGRRVVRMKSSKLSSHQMPVGGSSRKVLFDVTSSLAMGIVVLLVFDGPAAADGHGVEKAACEHFRGYGLWLGTDTLHPRVSEGPRRSLARQSKVTVRLRRSRRRQKPDTFRGWGLDVTMLVFLAGMRSIKSSPTCTPVPWSVSGPPVTGGLSRLHSGRVQLCARSKRRNGSPSVTRRVAESMRYGSDQVQGRHPYLVTRACGVVEFPSRPQVAR